MSKKTKQSKQSKKNKTAKKTQTPQPESDWTPRPRDQAGAKKKKETPPYKFMALFFGIPTAVLTAAIIVRIVNGG